MQTIVTNEKEICSTFQRTRKRKLFLRDLNDYQLDLTFEEITNIYIKLTYSVGV